MKFYLGFLCAALCPMVLAGSVQADTEWEETTPFYEDDAWYDISEWFDGNDYNPTDEEFGEWDDEVFQYDADSTDTDNDWNAGFYSTDHTSEATDDDNWFYDYYDGVYDYSYYNDDTTLYESVTKYYDYDNDGSNDAFATWYDWDSDGYYEDYNYFTFNEAGDEQQKGQTKQQSPKESRQYQITGTIEKMKDVQVRNNTHSVVTLNAKGKSAFVDLGPANELKELNLNKGDKIAVAGPKAPVGKTSILIAQQVQSGNREIDVHRQNRQIDGKVASTHESKIRGKQHLIAMVETGKSRKVAVDLGVADKLDTQIQQGAELSFNGVPVKVKDRKLIVADEVIQDGERIKIDRRQQKSDAKNTTAK